MQRQCTRIRPVSNRPAALLCAAALTMLAGAMPAQAVTERPAVSARAVSAHQDDWYQHLYEMLRAVYLLLGGDPAELEGQSIEWVVAIVCAHYQAQGLPPDLDSKQRETLSQLLGDLRVHIADAPPGFDPETAANVQALIDAIHADLESTPSVGR